MPCKGLKNSAQGNALGGKENEDEDEYENENCLADGNYKLYTLNTKQENINAMTRDFKHEVFDLLMGWNRVVGYARRHAG